jgi:hypothetical protein
VHKPRVVKSILAAGSVQIISDWFIFDYSEYIKLSKHSARTIGYLVVSHSYLVSILENTWKPINIFV